MTAKNPPGGTGGTGGTSSGLVYAGGLTLDQAQGLEGVAKVGQDQPAWKDR